VFESSSLFLADAQLEQVAALQRTMNASFAQLCQLLTELHHDAPEPDAEFLADQVALLLQVCPVTAQNLLGLALTVTGLPALLEALQRDLLTERHVRAIIGELGKTPLTQLQQAAVVAVVLAKLHGQTPGELVRLVQRTVLLIDLGAAERRRQARIRERRVSFHPGTDGEATLIATGPLAQTLLSKPRSRPPPPILSPATNAATTSACSTCSSTCSPAATTGPSTGPPQSSCPTAPAKAANSNSPRYPASAPSCPAPPATCSTTPAACNASPSTTATATSSPSTNTPTSPSPTRCRAALQPRWATTGLPAQPLHRQPSNRST